MRALTFLLLLSISAWAEDWTTTDGKHYQNVTVVKVEDDAVTILDDDGGALVPLEKLPANLQKRFNYDPAKAKAAADARKQTDAANNAALEAEKDETDTLKQEADIKAAAQIADAQKAIILQQPSDNQSEPIKKSKNQVRGSVFQKVDEGLLLSLDVMENTENGVMFVPYDSYPVGARKIILLQDYSGEKDAVDGDRIFVDAYPIGSYSYIDTDGSKATVKKFTIDASKASAYQEENTQETANTNSQ